MISSWIGRPHLQQPTAISPAGDLEVGGSFRSSGACLLKVTAVRARYEHLAGSWRRATPERRRGLIGELELLALQLPAVQPR